MSLAAMPAWLTEYEPQLPLPDLVEQTNKIFHELEARHYDRRHPETAREWVELWREMIAVVDGRTPAGGWRILDFGCGTGFASTQLLDRLPTDNVAGLMCYDLSEHMLAQCRTKIAPRMANARFCHCWEELEPFAPYNLLATNSLLHHLPDPTRVLQRLRPLLSADAVWLAGHEPSSRFYKNAECMRLAKEYRRVQRKSWRRYLAPSAWWQKMRKLSGQAPSPKTQTARLVVERGLFRRSPPPNLIDRLVDYHVPHSTDEAEQGRGFDIAELQHAWHNDWQLAWTKSYAFLGHSREESLLAKWRTACQHLAKRYPLDGANFVSVWRRAKIS